MRRVFLHLGLHKTGTSAAQSFLYENRELIWPRYALVLPYKTRKSGLSEAATRHSVYCAKDTLAAFDIQIRNFLSILDFGEKRGLIVSEENFLGLRPSRNISLGYAAAPDLAETLVRAVQDRFRGQQVEVTVYISVRQRNSWIKSLWAHDLRRTRLVQDFDEFAAGLIGIPSPPEIAAEIKTKLSSAAVQMEWLETLKELPFGPGTPFAQFLNLPNEKRKRLGPPATDNARLPDVALTELLRLNRSSLDEASLIRQKAAIIQNAQDDRISTT
ncbi:MAG: hypothetical protein ACR2O2_09575 [Ruegeria sp.]